MINNKNLSIAQRRGIAGGLNSIDGNPAIKKALQDFAVNGLKEVTAGFSEEVARAETQMKADGARLGKLYHLRSLVYKDPDLLPPDQKSMLHREINMLENRMNRMQEDLEKRAGQISAYLSDPDMTGILGKLPEDELNPLMDSALEGLEKTAAGQKFFEKQINPVLQGHSKNPLWENAFKSSDFGVNLLGKFSTALAKAGEASYLNAMAKVLNIKNAKDLAKVEEILMNYKKTKDTSSAMKNLRNMGLGKDMSDSKLTGMLGKMGDAFAIMNFAIGMNNLFKDPNLKNALTTAKDAAILSETIGKLVQKSSHLQKFSKLAGIGKFVKAVPPIDIVLGAIGMKESVERGDTAGAAFNALTTAGGVVATAGLVLDGTVVGAVAGVPLTVIGGIMAVTGALGNWIFGDSEAEIFAKELGYIT